MYLIYNTNIAFINELNILCMTGVWSPCTGSQISSSTYSYVRTYIVALECTYSYIICDDCETLLIYVIVFCRRVDLGAGIGG